MMLWTREPARAPQSDDQKIGNELFGNNDFLVCIFDDATKDVAASEAKGRPVYVGSTLIAVRIVNEHDYMARPLTEADVTRFPRAWHAYQGRKAGPKHVDVALLPGIQLAQVKALHDMKLGDIVALAKADPLDDELEPFRMAAIKFAKPRFRVVDGELKEVAA